MYYTRYSEVLGFFNSQDTRLKDMYKKIVMYSFFETNEKYLLNKLNFEMNV